FAVSLCLSASPRSSLRCVSLFFFQAEDGIRDFHVTGVQTCALPISLSASFTPTQAAAARAATMTTLPRGSALPVTSCSASSSNRSEERRVGKEGRSRRWPVEYIKKEKRQCATSPAQPNVAWCRV